MVAQSQIPGRDFAIVHGTVTAKPRCVPIQNSFRQSATYRAVEEIQKNGGDGKFGNRAALLSGRRHQDGRGLLLATRKRIQFSSL